MSEPIQEQMPAEEAGDKIIIYWVRECQGKEEQIGIVISAFNNSLGR